MFFKKALPANQKIGFLHVRAPWSPESEAWTQEVADSAEFKELSPWIERKDFMRDQDPVADQGLQFLLQSQSAQMGWPANFFYSANGSLLFACGALKKEDFLNLTQQLISAYKVDPHGLEAQGRMHLQNFQERDPLQQSKAVDKHSHLTDLQKIESFLSPLEQSVSWEFGWVGQGTHVHYPYVYRTLMATQELSKVGEAALVQLARSPMCDVIGGGFFRAYDEAQGPSTEKLLVDQAELLECYVEAQTKNKKPFMSQVALELVDLLMTEFWDDNQNCFSESVSYPKAFYELSGSDLLKALPPASRRAAQNFFGLEGSERIPRLSTEMPLLAEFLGTEQVDLRLQLADTQKKLKIFRQARWQESKVIAPAKRAASAATELVAVRALLFAAHVFDVPKVLDVAFERLEFYQKAFAEKNDFSLRAQGAYLRATLAAVRVNGGLKERAQEARWMAEFEKELGKVASDPFEIAMTPGLVKMEIPFPGARMDLMDFTGASGVSEYLAALMDFRALLQQGYKSPSGLGAEPKFYLDAYFACCQRLGLHAASYYWCLSRIL